MKIGLDWLNQYLDRPTDAEEAERVLTDIGFPLDGVDEAAGDTVLDVEVTSNRPDMLSHVGVARELAAATGRQLVEPGIELSETGEAVEKLTAVDNRAEDLCPLYTARVIRGVTVAPSPDWLVRRIEAIGLRPVNNIVDITNFVLHELGQPLHAFDMNLLSKRRIVVRRAQNGEPFTAIDGSKHELRDSMLVIADANKPVAVAGVMGGMDSEVGNATTDVLLESARFDPLSVRSTSRALKLSSDSSYRFERGVDRLGVERASRRAAQLIVELAGGEPATGVIAAGAAPAPPHTVTLRPSRCADLLGIDIEPGRMVELLAALGLQPQPDGDAIACTVPTHRLDLHREVDLIEEVARLHGYEQITVEPDMHLTVRPPQRSIEARRLIDRVLTAHGYCETITFSNLAVSHAEPFRGEGAELILMNEEQKKAEPALRPSVLPSLLDCRKLNQDAGNAEVKLFEAAKTFWRVGADYVEQKQLALLSDAEDPEAALRQMRGTIEELADALGCALRITAADPGPTWASPAARVADPDQPQRTLGEYGLASDALIKRFDLQKPVALGWLDYQAITAGYPSEPDVAELPRFPGIERDLSVVVDEAVPWARIAEVVDSVGPDRMEDYSFVTVFRGKQVGQGRKSVTLRLCFRDPQKTLRHEEVDGQVEQLVTRLQQELGAELRA